MTPCERRRGCGLVPASLGRPQETSVERPRMLDVLRGRSCIAQRYLDRSIRCLILVLILSAVGAAGLRAQEVGPRAVVSSFQDTLLATMKEAGPLGFEGRYQ